MIYTKELCFLLCMAIPFTAYGLPDETSPAVAIHGKRISWEAYKASQRIGAPWVTPGAILPATPSQVLVTTKITDSRLIANSVTAYVMNNNGEFVKSLGPLNDNGTNGDKVAGDHIFSGLFDVSAGAKDDVFRVGISATFKDIPQPVQGGVFDINIRCDLDVFNAKNDFWADTMGTDGIAFNFANVPEGTAHIQILRSAKATGPWIVAIDEQYNGSLPQTLVDKVDGTINSYYYKMEAFGAGNKLLKSYGHLFVLACPDE